ncbi:MAG: glycosyltransferase [Planctomycetota bacterium]|jgi:glycosyltransferase involved in cell wall biosynthesis
MKVLHVIQQLGIGGAEKQLYELIVNSDPEVMTHEVLYYSDSLDTEAKKLYDGANIKTTRIPRNKKRPLKFLKDFAKEVKNSNAEIVHCWLFGANIWGRLAALMAGHKKIIVAYRGGALGYAPVMRMLELFTGSRVHHLANSRACANMTARRTGLKPDKFNVIYNGVDLKGFEVNSIRPQLCRDWSISSDAKIVTMVGRLTASKNYPMLLKLAQRAKAEKMNTHFLIVGHGEQENELKELAKTLDVHQGVHFLGLRHDVPAILISSDIFCYTTLFEGFPNALLEAMTAGLPIITTGFDGVDELITEGVNGTIVPFDEVDHAFEILKRYVANEELAKSLGAKAHEVVVSGFNVQHMVSETLQYYKKIHL